MMSFKLLAVTSALAMPISAAYVTTQVKFSGDFPDGMFKAHLHADQCANSGGGGHYNGGDGGTVDDVNENWPEVTCANGHCMGAASNAWTVGAIDLIDGMSIVVHNTPNNNEKMLCADLMWAGGYYTGTLDYLDPESEIYGPAMKSAVSLFQPWVKTMVEFHGDGFPDGAFKAHLHADKCANSGGGGHYNGGDGISVDAVNENWPAVTCMDGKCKGWAWNNWSPTQAELMAGLSIVVHDTLDLAASPPNPKMLCADLMMKDATTWTGSLAYLDSYLVSSAGYGVLHDHKGGNWVSLSKPNALSTWINFYGHDFPDGTFNAHLHADKCANSGGGGHYKGGDGITVDAVNENWPAVTCTDGKCTGMAVNDWHPMTEATLSLVVHDTPNNGGSGSGPKMLCADISSNGKAGKLEYLKSHTDTYGGYGKVQKSYSGLAVGPKVKRGGKGGARINIGVLSNSGMGKGGKGKGGKGKGGKRGKKSKWGASAFAALPHATTAAAASAGILVAAVAITGFMFVTTRRDSAQASTSFDVKEPTGESEATLLSAVVFRS